MTSEYDCLLKTLGAVDIERVPLPRNKQIDKMLSTLDKVEDDLSDWEKDFVYDLTIRFTQDKKLTDRQFERLEEIYKRYED